MVVGVLIFIPWGRYELRQKDPAIDLRVLRQPNMWPVQLTAGLVGISLLGAQAPLATFAGTDPDQRVRTRAWRPTRSRTSSAPTSCR